MDEDFRLEIYEDQLPDLNEDVSNLKIRELTLNAWREVLLL